MRKKKGEKEGPKHWIISCDDVIVDDYDIKVCYIGGCIRNLTKHVNHYKYSNHYVYYVSHISQVSHTETIS